MPSTNHVKRNSTAGKVGRPPAGVGGEGQILLKVTGVDDSNPGDALDNDARQIDAIAQASGDDILDQMVSELQKGYGVAINQQLADVALSQ